MYLCCVFIELLSIYMCICCLIYVLFMCCVIIDRSVYSYMILQPTDKEEIANVIASLNSNKASCPNSIRYRILFHLKMKFRSSWQIYSTSLP